MIHCRNEDHLFMHLIDHTIGEPCYDAVSISATSLGVTEGPFQYEGKAVPNVCTEPTSQAWAAIFEVPFRLIQLGIRLTMDDQRVAHLPSR